MVLAGAALAALALAGCRSSGPRKLDLPTPEAARLAYANNRGVRRVTLDGKIVVFHVRQSTRELRQGGSVWGKVGPYVYLFSPGTRNLFERYTDLAGVKVVTFLPDGQEVAWALLPRDTMTDLLWKRSLNILGHALQQGTQNPAMLNALVQWGESHTRFGYNRKFLPH